MPFEIEEDHSGEPPRAAAPKSFLGRTAHVVGKLLVSTGRAAWVTGTTLLVLVVPLIIEMDREQQLTEMENQQLGVLSGPAPGGAAPAAAAPAK